MSNPGPDDALRDIFNEGCLLLVRRINHQQAPPVVRVTQLLRGLLLSCCGILCAAELEHALLDSLRRIVIPMAAGDYDDFNVVIKKKLLSAKSELDISLFVSENEMLLKRVCECVAQGQEHNTVSIFQNLISHHSTSILWMIADDYLNESILQRIVRFDKHELCHLLKQHYSVRIDAEHGARRDDGLTGNCAIVTLAFTEGAQGSHKNIFGETYLHIAARQLNLKLLGVMVNSNLGCSLNTKSDSGRNFMQVLAHQFYRNCLHISRRYSNNAHYSNYQFMFADLDRQFSSDDKLLGESELRGFYNDLGAFFDYLLISHIKLNKINDLIILLLHGCSRKEDGAAQSCYNGNSSNSCDDYESRIDDDSAFMYFMRSHKMPVISKIFSIISSIVRLRALETNTSMLGLNANYLDVDTDNFVWNITIVKQICASNSSAICDFVFGCMLRSSSSSKKLCKFSDFRIAFLREISEFCVDNHKDVALNSLLMTILSLHNSCNIVSIEPANSKQSYSTSELLEYLIERLLYIKWEYDALPIIKMIKNVLIVYSTYTTLQCSPVFSKLKPNVSRFNNIISSLKSRYYSRFSRTYSYKVIFDDLSRPLEASSVHDVAAFSINNIDNIFSLVALTGNIEIMRLILLHVSELTGKSALKFDSKGSPITSSNFIFHNLRCFSNPIICCIFSAYFQNIRDKFSSLSLSAAPIMARDPSSQSILEYLLFHTEFKILINMPEIVCCGDGKIIDRSAGGFRSNVYTSTGDSIIIPSIASQTRNQGNIMCISALSAAFICNASNDTLRLLKKYSIASERVMVTNPFSRFYLSSKMLSAQVSDHVSASAPTSTTSSTTLLMNYLYLKPKNIADTSRVVDLCKEIYFISKGFDVYNFLELAVIMKLIKKTIHLNKLLDCLFQYVKLVALAISPRIFKRLSHLNASTKSDVDGDGSDGGGRYGWVKFIGSSIQDIQIVMNLALEARVFRCSQSDSGSDVIDGNEGANSGSCREFVILPLSLLSNQLKDDKSKGDGGLMRAPYFNPAKRSAPGEVNFKASLDEVITASAHDDSRQSNVDDVRNSNSKIKLCNYEMKRIREIVAEVVHIAKTPELLFSEILAKVNWQGSSRVLIFLKKLIRYFIIVDELLSFEQKNNISAKDVDIINKNIGLWVKGGGGGSSGGCHESDMYSSQIISADIIYRSDYFNNVQQLSSYKDSVVGDSYYWVEPRDLELAYCRRLSVPSCASASTAYLSPSLIFRKKFYWYNANVAEMILDSSTSSSVISDIERYEQDKNDFILYLLDFNCDLKEDYFSKCNRIESAKQIQGTFRLTLKLFERLVLIADPELLLSLLLKNIIHCDISSIVQKSGYFNQNCGNLLKAKMKARFCFFDSVSQNEHSIFSSAVNQLPLSNNHKSTTSLDRKIIVFADILKCVKSLDKNTIVVESAAPPIDARTPSSSSSRDFVLVRNNNLNISFVEADLASIFDFVREDNVRHGNLCSSKINPSFDLITDWAATSHCHGLLMIYVYLANDKTAASSTGSSSGGDGDGITDDSASYLGRLEVAASSSPSDSSSDNTSSSYTSNYSSTSGNSGSNTRPDYGPTQRGRPSLERYDEGSCTGIVHAITIYGGILPETLNKILLGPDNTNLQALVKSVDEVRTGDIDSSIYSIVLQSSRYNIRYLLQTSRIDETLHMSSKNLIINIIKNCENSDTMDSLIDLLTGFGKSGKISTNDVPSTNEMPNPHRYQHCCGNIALENGCLLEEISRNSYLNYPSTARLHRMLSCRCCGSIELNLGSKKDIRCSTTIYDDWKMSMNSSVNNSIIAKYSSAKIQFFDLKIKFSLSILNYLSSSSARSTTKSSSSTSSDSPKQEKVSLLSSHLDHPEKIHSGEFEPMIQSDDVLGNIILTSDNFKFGYTTTGDAVGSTDSTDSGALTVVTSFLQTSLRLLSDKRDLVSHILTPANLTNFDDAELFSFECLSLVLTCLKIKDEMSLLNFIVKIISHPLQTRREIINDIVATSIGKSLLTKLISEFLSSGKMSLSGLWKLWLSHFRDFLLCHICSLFDSGGHNSPEKVIIATDKSIQDYFCVKIELDSFHSSNICIERNINSFKRVLEDHKTICDERDTYFWNRFNKLNKSNAELFNSTEFEIIKPLVCLDDNDFLLVRSCRLIPSKFLEVYDAMFVKTNKFMSCMAAVGSKSNDSDSIVGHMMFNIWLFINDFPSNPILAGALTNGFVTTLRDILNDYLETNRPLLLLCADIGGRKPRDDGNSQSGRSINNSDNNISNNVLVSHSLAKSYKEVMVSIHFMSSILSAIQFVVNKDTCKGFKSIHSANKILKVTPSKSIQLKKLLLNSSALNNIKLLHYYLDFIALYNSNADSEGQIKYSMYENFEILNSLLLTYNEKVCIKFMRLFPLDPPRPSDLPKSPFEKRAKGMAAKWPRPPAAGMDSPKTSPSKAAKSSSRTLSDGAYKTAVHSVSTDPTPFTFGWNFYHTLVFNCKSWSEMDSRYFASNIIKDSDIFCRWNPKDIFSNSKNNDKNDSTRVEGLSRKDPKQNIALQRFKRTNHFKLLNFLIRSDNRFDILRSSIKVPFVQLLSLIDMLVICSCGSSNNTFANSSANIRSSASSNKLLTGGGAVLTFMRLYTDEFVDSTTPFTQGIPVTAIIISDGDEGSQVSSPSSQREATGKPIEMELSFTTFMFAHVFVSKRNMQFVELLREAFSSLKEIKELKGSNKDNGSVDFDSAVKRSNKWLQILTSERPVYVDNIDMRNSSVYSIIEADMANNNFRTVNMENIFKYRAAAKHSRGKEAVDNITFTTTSSTTVIIRQSLLLDAIVSGDEYYFLQMLSVVSLFSEECGVEFKIDGLLFYAVMFDMKNAIESLLLIHKRRKLSVLSAFTSAPSHFSVSVLKDPQRQQWQRKEDGDYSLRADILQRTGSSLVSPSHKKELKSNCLNQICPFLNGVSPLIISVIKSNVKTAELMLLRLWKLQETIIDDTASFQNLLEQLIITSLVFRRDNFFEMLCKFINGSVSFQMAITSASLFAPAKAFDTLPVGSLLDISLGPDSSNSSFSQSSGGVAAYERLVRDPFLKRSFVGSGDCGANIAAAKDGGFASSNSCVSSNSASSSKKSFDVSSVMFQSIYSLLCKKQDSLSVLQFFISKKMLAGLAVLLFVADEQMIPTTVLEQSFHEAEAFDYDASILLTLSISIFKRTGSFFDFDKLPELYEQQATTRVLSILKADAKLVTEKSASSNFNLKSGSESAAPLQPSQSKLSSTSDASPLQSKGLDKSVNTIDVNISGSSDNIIINSGGGGSRSLGNENQVPCYPTTVKPIRKLKYRSVFDM